MKQEDTPTATAAAATTVTEDDITKIIVRKIKQIVPTMRKSVPSSDLRASESQRPACAKYEAFLTDISQL